MKNNLILVTLLALAVALPAAADPLSPGARAAARKAGNGLVEVIIRYDRTPSVAEERRLKADGGRMRRAYRHLPMRVMRVPAHALERIAKGRHVRSVTTNSVVRGQSIAARQTANLPVHGGYYELPAVSSDVGIAVLDSGLKRHWDLNEQRALDCRAAALWSSSQLCVDADYRDPFGHGTHVAGVAAGNGAISDGLYAGVAPSAPIYSLRVLDDEGAGVVSDVIGALDWVLEHGQMAGIRVVNLSLGKGIEESAEADPLVAAVERVWDAGFVVVVSAGNYGEHGNFTITSPGNSRKVITVGSITDAGTGDDFGDDYVSSYSSRGPSLVDHVLKPDLLAPGNRFVAPNHKKSYLKELLGEQSGITCDDDCEEDYLELSGTSMAAAMVSGAAALMLAQDPALTPATIKARLMRSARKVPGDTLDTGAGVLDVPAALADAGVVAGEALSPLLARSALGNVIMVEDTAALWGDDEWSAGYLWAKGYLWANSYSLFDGYLWADAYLWANGYLWAKSEIWADGYLWANGYLWAQGYLWANHVGSGETTPASEAPIGD